MRAALQQIVEEPHELLVQIRLVGLVELEEVGRVFLEVLEQCLCLGLEVLEQRLCLGDPGVASLVQLHDRDGGVVQNDRETDHVHHLAVLAVGVALEERLVPHHHPDVRRNQEGDGGDLAEQVAGLGVGHGVLGSRRVVEPRLELQADEPEPHDPHGGVQAVGHVTPGRHRPGEAGVPDVATLDGADAAGRQVGRRQPQGRDEPPGRPLGRRLGDALLEVGLGVRVGHVYTFLRGARCTVVCIRIFYYSILTK